MKKVLGISLFLFLSTSVWAGIGETKEEALKRYGEPTRWENKNTCAWYDNEDIPFWILFYTNESGKTVSGQISYKMPADREVANALVLRLLELHGEGRKWAPYRDSITESREDSTKYKRYGASAAHLHPGFLSRLSDKDQNWLLIATDEFTAYAKRLVALAEENKKQKKEAEIQRILNKLK